MTRHDEAHIFAHHPQVPLAQAELSFRRMDYMIATENVALFERLAKSVPSYVEQRDYYRLQMQNAAKAFTKAQRNYEHALKQAGLTGLDEDEVCHAAA